MIDCWELSLQKQVNEIKNGKKLIGDLILKPVELNEDYANEWNEHSRDFGHLYKGGKKISNTLYRIGGFGINASDKYFQLIKHKEAYYSEEILKMSKSKDGKHLKSTFCILNAEGVEKVAFKKFDSGYVHGCIYSLDSNYFNIETGAFYCKSYSSMETDNYLFLHNRYDDDKSKHGVIKINKNDGSFEILN